MKYTILELGKDTKVKFDHDDGSIESKEALETALVEYERAYITGKQVEEVSAAADVQALLNKPQTV